ncbi:hypothetical protein ACFLYR_04610 [Chloroflexota bacterium]
MAYKNACGFRPVIDWPDRNGLKDFAEALLGIWSHIKDKHSSGIVSPIIELNFGDDENK